MIDRRGGWSLAQRALTVKRATPRHRNPARNVSLARKGKHRVVRRPIPTSLPNTSFEGGCAAPRARGDPRARNTAFGSSCARPGRRRHATGGNGAERAGARIANFFSIHPLALQKPIKTIGVNVARGKGRGSISLECVAAQGRRGGVAVADGGHGG